jgi:hypothetical protein
MHQTLSDKAGYPRKCYDATALVISFRPSRGKPHYFHVGHGNLNTLSFELLSLRESENQLRARCEAALGNIALQATTEDPRCGAANSWKSFRLLDLRQQWSLGFYRLASHESPVSHHFSVKEVSVSELAYESECFWHGPGRDPPAVEGLGISGTEGSSEDDGWDEQDADDRDSSDCNDSSSEGSCPSDDDGNIHPELELAAIEGWDVESDHSDANEPEDLGRVSVTVGWWEVERGGVPTSRKTIVSMLFETRCSFIFGLPLASQASNNRKMCVCVCVLCTLIISWIFELVGQDW